MPSSRPKPDCLKPPNGVATRTDVFELSESTPVSIKRATLIARAASRVQTEPDRPYGVSLAMRIASASSSKGMIAATGPKTSSRATRSELLASTSVHGNQKPGPDAAFEHRLAVDVRRHQLAVRSGDERTHVGALGLGVPDLETSGRVSE